LLWKAYFLKRLFQEGLNMFLVCQVSVNFGISPSSNFYTNLVLHL